MGSKQPNMQMFFRLVFDDKTVYAEYNTKNFEEVLLEEWEILKGAGDRVEVIKRAYQRACDRFKIDAVSHKV